MTPNSESASNTASNFIHSLLGMVVLSTAVSGEGAAAIVLSPRSEIRNPERTRKSRWRLEINNAAWRLQSSSAVLAASGDSRRFSQTLLERLGGTALERANVVIPHLDIVLKFDGLEFRSFSFYSGSDPRFFYWRIIGPSGQILTVGPGAASSVTIRGARSDA